MVDSTPGEWDLRLRRDTDRWPWYARMGSDEMNNGTVSEYDTDHEVRCYVDLPDTIYRPHQQAKKKWWKLSHRHGCLQYSDC